MRSHYNGKGTRGRLPLRPVRLVMARSIPRVLIAFLPLIVGFSNGKDAVAQTSPTFNQEIRPILSTNCFECHGPDEDTREADLRLDHRDAAVEDRGGYQAVVPGNAAKSELFARMISDDPDLRMPPADSNKRCRRSRSRPSRRGSRRGRNISSIGRSSSPNDRTFPGRRL